MTKILSLGLVFCLLAFGIHGHAKADEACQHPAELVADVVRTAAPTLVVEQIADIRGDVSAIVEAFNSLPPASEFQADQVVVLHALSRISGQEHPQWVVALFFHDCKQAAAMVPSAKFKPLVGTGA